MLQAVRVNAYPKYELNVDMEHASFVGGKGHQSDTLWEDCNNFTMITGMLQSPEIVNNNMYLFSCNPSIFRVKYS